jgi:hypothetical protein
MFNFNKKVEKDPKKALENADKTLNKGLTGALVKGFMGKDFVNEMNQSLDMGKNAVAGVEQMQALMQNGLDGTAEVVSIADTGAMVNYNPVVLLQLKVTPASGAAFDTTGQTMVSKIAVPRVGDKIKIKFDPADKTKFVVV